MGILFIMAFECFLFIFIWTQTKTIQENLCTTLCAHWTSALFNLKCKNGLQERRIIDKSQIKSPYNNRKDICYSAIRNSNFYIAV